MSYPPQGGNYPPQGGNYPPQGGANYPPAGGGQQGGYPPQDAPAQYGGQYGQPQGQPYGQPGQPGQPQGGNHYGQPVGAPPQYPDPYGQQGSSIPPYGQPQGQPYMQGGYQYGGGGTANLAGVGSRFLALLVDAVILGIPSGIIGGIVGAMAAGSEDGSVPAIGILLYLVLIVVAILYEPLMTSRKGAGNGQTIGKQVAKVRIVDQATGGQIGTGQAWIRFLIRSFISGLIFYLGYLWALWDPQKQTWHDKIAKTLVVRA